MKSPKCKECKHAMSEHGPDGCKWCEDQYDEERNYCLNQACKVKGTFAKPWEQTVDENISTINSSNEKISDNVLISLKIGRDKYSRMNRKELEELSNISNCDHLSDNALRWICRGLSEGNAIRKSYLTDQASKNYAYAHQFAYKG